MSRIRVIAIIGTRPEAIKMAPVVKEIGKYPDKIELCVCSTGQHREMLYQVFDFFDIKPDIELNLMSSNQTLANLTSKAISYLSDTFKSFLPKIVLVQGDTTTAMAGALAGFYDKIPVGHIEAGLRTGDMYNPFPEEINRRLISVLTTYHFAPTESAVKALLNEGIPKEKIFLTGNTVIDALFMTLKLDCNVEMEPLKDDEKMILVTAHRRESLGKPLQNICTALKEIARRNEKVRIIYPVHLNPNVRKVVYTILSGQKRVNLIEPLSYEKFVHLMNLSYLILTDSGGIQEEAPALGKPVLVLRNETERLEAVMAGSVKVVGTDPEVIIGETERLLNDHEMYTKMSKAVSPYGDGHAAERIVNVIRQMF